MVFNWNSNLETKESFISENPSAKTKDISEKFDVSYGLVSKIRNNKLDMKILVSGLQKTRFIILRI